MYFEFSPEAVREDMHSISILGNFYEEDLELYDENIPDLIQTIHINLNLILEYSHGLPAYELFDQGLVNLTLGNHPLISEQLKFLDVVGRRLEDASGEYWNDSTKESWKDKIASVSEKLSDLASNYRLLHKMKTRSPFDSIQMGERYFEIHNLDTNEVLVICWNDWVDLLNASSSPNIGGLKRTDLLRTNSFENRSFSKELVDALPVHSGTKILREKFYHCRLKISVHRKLPNEEEEDF